MKKIEIIGTVIFVLAFGMSIVFAFTYNATASHISYLCIVLAVVLLIRGSKISEMFNRYIAA